MLRWSYHGGNDRSSMWWRELLARLGHLSVIKRFRRENLYAISATGDRPTVLKIFFFSRYCPQHGFCVLVRHLASFRLFSSLIVSSDCHLLLLQGRLEVLWAHDELLNLGVLDYIGVHIFVIGSGANITARRAIRWRPTLHASQLSQIDVRGIHIGR